jgi:hypothetical protein
MQTEVPDLEGNIAGVDFEEIAKASERRGSGPIYPIEVKDKENKT